MIILPSFKRKLAKAAWLSYTHKDDKLIIQSNFLNEVIHGMKLRNYKFILVNQRGTVKSSKPTLLTF